MPIVALERWGPRLGGLCWFGQIGIGWLGPDHCWWCHVHTLEGLREAPSGR